MDTINTTSAPSYVCKACGAKVEIDGNDVRRACRCPEDTGVAANVSATCVGIGGLHPGRRARG